MEIRRWGWLACVLLAIGCVQRQQGQAQRVRGAYSPQTEKALQELDKPEDFQASPAQLDAIKSGMATIQNYADRARSAGYSSSEPAPNANYAAASAPPTPPAVQYPAPTPASSAPATPGASVPIEPPRQVIPDIAPRPSAPIESGPVPVSAPAGVPGVY